jgi:cyclin-dependent kinase-like
MLKYEILNVIGEGSYGTVYRCRHRESGRVMALKEFKETTEDDLVRKTTNRELKMLRTLKHPNVVDFKEVFKNKAGMICLVFEFVENNLLEVLDLTQNGLPPEMIRSILYQIVKGLAFMHASEVVHRDIKPENILVGGKFEKVVKICDFGFARSTRRESGFPFTEYVATRWYRPPELLVGAPYSTPIDIWALGCIMGELTDGNPLFPGGNEMDQLFLIQKCLGRLTPELHEYFLKHPPFLGIKFPEIMHIETLEKRYVGKLQPQALSLLKGMLRINPEERLTALACLKHGYFDEVRNREDIKLIEEGAFKDLRLQSATSYHDELEQRRREAIQSRAEQEAYRFTRKDETRLKDPKIGPYHSKSINKTKINFRKKK